MRTVFLVDGFNVYHSLKDAECDAGAGTRWLDLKKLCENHLYLIDSEASLQDVYYFTAKAKWLIHKKPNVVKRHEKYIKCLKEVGVKV